MNYIAELIDSRGRKSRKNRRGCVHFDRLTFCEQFTAVEKSLNELGGLSEILTEDQPLPERTRWEKSDYLLKGDRLWWGRTLDLGMR